MRERHSKERKSLFVSIFICIFVYFFFWDLGNIFHFYNFCAIPYLFVVTPANHNFYFSLFSIVYFLSLHQVSKLLNRFLSAISSKKPIFFLPVLCLSLSSCVVLCLCIASQIICAFISSFLHKNVFPNLLLLLDSSLLSNLHPMQETTTTRDQSCIILEKMNKWFCLMKRSVLSKDFQVISLSGVFFSIQSTRALAHPCDPSSTVLERKPVHIPLKSSLQNVSINLRTFILRK